MSVQARSICLPDRILCRAAATPGARLTSAAVPLLADLRKPRRVTAGCSAVSAVTVAEEEANQKRWEESGKQNSSDSWRWTLNWNTINDNIVVGSCPRSTQDIVRCSARIMSGTCCIPAVACSGSSVPVSAAFRGMLTGGFFQVTLRREAGIDAILNLQVRPAAMSRRCPRVLL